MEGEYGGGAGGFPTSLPVWLMALDGMSWMSSHSLGLGGGDSARGKIAEGFPIAPNCSFTASSSSVYPGKALYTVTC